MPPMNSTKKQPVLTATKSAWAFIAFAVLGIAAEIQAGQNVVVVLDDSGSMQQKLRTNNGRISRIEAAKEALSKVVQGLPDDAQLGILLLNNRGRGNTWLVPLGPLSTTAVLPKIAQIRADGGTPLGSQMKAAADALLELRQKQIYGEYRLLVITDGEASDANLLNAYLPDILSRGLSLDVIGVDMADKHSLESRAHSYRRANDLASFEKALQEIFAESNSRADDQGTSDFETIADLPDELAKAALASLAIPKNSPIGFANNQTESHPDAAGPVTPATQVAPAPTAPSVSLPVQTNAVGTIVGFLSLLPCCFVIILVFVLVVAFGQSKKRKVR